MLEFVDLHLGPSGWRFWRQAPVMWEIPFLLAYGGHQMIRGPSLADLILRKLVAHDLPRDEPVKTWSGCGQGNLCDACGESIREAQFEYQIALGPRLFRLHLGCHALWTTEVHRRRWVAPDPR
jgi:hypothetical protein